MEKSKLSREIKLKGLELGFSKVGVTTADDFTEFESEIRSRPDYDLWVNTKRAFLGQGSRPRSFYPEARSIVCAVYSFAGIKFPEELDRYVGRAYLSRAFRPLEGSSCRLRINEFRKFLESLGCSIYAGDIRIPDRFACARAGVVTYGNNNFAYTEGDGSFIILYTFLVDMELEYDEPTVENNCPPDCHACIDACPTQAIISPTRLHPQNCLLYSHISKEPVPVEIRQRTGTYIHGCDICQKACPRNKKILENASRKDGYLEALKEEFDLEKILLMDDIYYKDIVYPIMYNYIHDIDIFKRNAAIALGNTNDRSHVPALKQAARSQNPFVRDAAEWSIERLTNLY